MAVADPDLIKDLSRVSLEPEAADLHGDDVIIEQYTECDCVDLVDTYGKPGKIPYWTVYSPETFFQKKTGFFIPGLPVTGKIVSRERDTSRTHYLNPFLYTVELNHGPFNWTIQKRYNEFQHLHNRLLLFRAAERMKRPVRRLRNRRAGLAKTLEYEEETNLTENLAPKQEGIQPSTSGVSPQKLEIPVQQAEKPPRSSLGADPTHPHHSLDHPEMHKDKASKLPHFSVKPDSIISDSNRDERTQKLESYLNSVLHMPAYRNHPETLEFLEICRLSFVHNLGCKSREGLVKKRPGGRKTFVGFKRFCIEHCSRWDKR